jgi:hypothetical protein
MKSVDTVIAVFADHPAAEMAIKKLAAEGFDMKALSVVGKGYHSDEKITGFYNAGDRIKLWGTRGAFWGGLWGLFLAVSSLPYQWSGRSSSLAIWPRWQFPQSKRPRGWWRQCARCGPV